MKIIGRSVLVDFSEVGLGELKAKVDTGAYTSSIHCSWYKAQSDQTIECILLDPEHPSYTGKRIILPLLKDVSVKSSDGISEQRPMVQTSITLGEEKFDLYLTLTNRKDMRYPVLLGRRFLADRFLVDVTRKS